LCITFNGPSNILIYIERVKVLVSNLLKLYREREIIVKKQELKDIKRQIEEEKMKSRPAGKTSAKPLPMAEIVE
jgi:hypothetical protein